MMSHHVTLRCFLLELGSVRVTEIVCVQEERRGFGDKV